jgi:hypothetical protein
MDRGQPSNGLRQRNHDAGWDNKVADNKQDAGWGTEEQEASVPDDF